MDASRMRLLNPKAASCTGKDNSPPGTRSKAEHKARQYDQPEGKKYLSETLRYGKMVAQHLRKNLKKR